MPRDPRGRRAPRDRGCAERRRAARAASPRDGDGERAAIAPAGRSIRREHRNDLGNRRLPRGSRQVGAATRPRQLHRRGRRTRPLVRVHALRRRGRGVGDGPHRVHPGGTAGRPRSILLAAWARTGWWANPAAVTDVELSLARTDDADAGFDASEECEVTVRVRAGGLIVASMYVDTNTWLPRRMRMRVCGDDEMWFYTDWKNAELDGKDGAVRRARASVPRAHDAEGRRGGHADVPGGRCTRQLGCRAGILPQTRVTPRRREGRVEP